MDMKLEVVVVPVSDVDKADWPTWYAQYMADGQAGYPAEAGRGAST